MTIDNFFLSPFTLINPSSFILLFGLPQSFLPRYDIVCWSYAAADNELIHPGTIVCCPLP